MPTKLQRLATHKCKHCNALWEYSKEFKAFHLRSETAGDCCDNTPFTEHGPLEQLPNVLYIEDHKPHLCIPLLTGDVAVVPVSSLLAVAEGRKPITSIADFEDISAVIISEWLEERIYGPQENDK